MAMPSCADYDNGAEPAPDNRATLSFAVSIDNGGISKTALASDGSAVNFVGNETMTVVASDVSHTEFTVSNSTSSATTFTSDYQPNKVLVSETFVAMYPEGNYTADGYGMTIPTEQTAVKDGFDPKANLLIASTTKESMTFAMNNVCSLVKVVLPQEAASITVSAKEKIAGNITVAPDGKCDGGTSNKVTLKPASGSSTIAAGTYYIAVKPGAVTEVRIAAEKVAPVLATSFELKRAQTHEAVLKKTESVSPSNLQSYLNKCISSSENDITIYLDSYTSSDAATVKTAWSVLNNDATVNKKVTLVLPDGTESIPADAFNCCARLTYVDIPESVTSIGDKAFYATNITSVKIPKGVKTIGEKAFRNCYKLTSVVISDGVETIGYAAFEYCSITSVTIPKSVKTIGRRAFFDCSLTNLELSEGLETIGELAFYNNRFSSITIPESVTYIDDAAFEDCDKLTTVKILGTPELATFDDVFQYCDQKEKGNMFIYVPKAKIEEFKKKNDYKYYNKEGLVKELESLK